jgi:hypothetical protein
MELKIKPVNVVQTVSFLSLLRSHTSNALLLLKQNLLFYTFSYFFYTMEQKSLPLDLEDSATTLVSFFPILTLTDEFAALGSHCRNTGDPKGSLSQSSKAMVFCGPDKGWAYISDEDGDRKSSLEAVHSLFCWWPEPQKSPITLVPLAPGLPF